MRTRFAPSPTGSLHVGNARIAVLNWLLARRYGGEFVLRIEDTDAERGVAGAEAGIFEDLAWLGLDVDEGPGIEGAFDEGPYAPYRQSERGAIYREHAERLVEAGLAYPCFCTPSELETRRREALEKGEAPHYAGSCRRLDDADRLRLEREGRAAALRFAVPETGAVEFEDAVRGGVRVEHADIGDFIILRSDGVPTYNFAVVVDDAMMRITHVVRGVGHLSNTPRQALLFDALGYDRPVFVHVPTVLGPDRQKLSKRHGAKALADYRREGIHPDGMLNYLSLLSWSSPSEDEILTRERLLAEISIERIRASDVVFDEEKLRWISARHIERMDDAELTEAVAPFVDRERYPIDDEALPTVVRAVRSHLSGFADINDHLDAFVPTLDAAGIAARDALRGDARAIEVLVAVRERLDSIDEWTEEAIAGGLREAGRDARARGRELYEPVRVAVTGRGEGPPIAAVLAVLGRATARDLLDQAIAENA